MRSSRCFPSTAPFRFEQSAASPFTLTFSFVYISKKGDEEALTFFFLLSRLLYLRSDLTASVISRRLLKSGEDFMNLQEDQ
ncbi:hypothetical protein AMELA_G00121960 [Ameiurus melas]|uniref:Uncharacterized protein n=1 Tax=Ameiurus melas TaxID=219545 RepID=A0A7J6APF7_AMEME|nr:hypothetical protein AMELA_G00121960 [Ameiurus melas]